jgi:hypothetical protein
MATGMSLVFGHRYSNRDCRARALHLCPNGLRDLGNPIWGLANCVEVNHGSKVAVKLTLVERSCGPSTVNVDARMSVCHITSDPLRQSCASCTRVSCDRDGPEKPCNRRFEVPRRRTLKHSEEARTPWPLRAYVLEE